MPVELGEALPVGGNLGVDDFFRGKLAALRTFAQTRLHGTPVARINDVRLAKMAVRTKHFTARQRLDPRQPHIVRPRRPQP